MKTSVKLYIHESQLSGLFHATTVNMADTYKLLAIKEIEVEFEPFDSAELLDQEVDRLYSKAAAIESEAQAKVNALLSMARQLKQGEKQ